MIKLNKILKEAIGKDLYSDSLPNARTNEFKGALAEVEDTLGHLRMYMKNYRGGKVGKRKGDLNYMYWSFATAPRKSMLKRLDDAVKKLTDIGYSNHKRAEKIKRDVISGKLKIKGLDDAGFREKK